MGERVKKQKALHYLELALGVDDKWFSFRLSDDGFRYARWILETLVSAQDEDE